MMDIEEDLICNAGICFDGKWYYCTLPESDAHEGGHSNGVHIWRYV